MADIEKLVELDSRPFIAPSGKAFRNADASLWLALENNRSFGWGPEVRFNSGFVSPVYLSMRNDLSTNMTLLQDVARNFRRFIQQHVLVERREVCLIGIPTAATQLAQAVATQSLAVAPRMCFKTMRSEPKDHGKSKDELIGPADTQRHAYCTLENVLSTGKAMLDKFKLMEPEGYCPRNMRHFIFASWNLGGRKNLAGADVHSVFIQYEIPDVIALFVYLSHWAKEREDIMTRKILDWNTR